MEQLTPFERALLAQFETLAHGSEASLKVSKAMESALRDYSAKVGARIQQIEARQSDLTAHLQDLDTALTVWLPSSSLISRATFIFAGVYTMRS